VGCPPIFRLLVHPSLALSKSNHSGPFHASILFPGEAGTRPALVHP